MEAPHLGSDANQFSFVVSKEKRSVVDILFYEDGAVNK